MRILPTAASGDRPRDRTLLAIIALAIALRAIIAYVALSPDAGFAADIAAFRYWTADLVAHGPWGMYGRGYFLDYLPGYLLVLWPTGVLSSLLTNDPGTLVKLPAIVGDGLLIVGAVRLSRDLGASARAQVVLAALLAIAPMTWLDSAVWGQVDSVGTAVMLFAVSSLVRGSTARGAALAALAAVIKPQFGILIPVVALLAIVRARREGDPWAVAVAALAGAATIALAALPFGLTIVDVLFKVFDAAGGYAYLSVNAWNPWALIEVGGRSIVSGTGWASDLDPLPLVGAPGVALGTAALLGALGAGLARLRRDRAATTVAVLAFFAIAFFVLPTRVHERYLYPAIPLTLVLAAAFPRWRPIAAIVSLHFLANGWGVLTFDYLKNPGLPDLGPLEAALHTPSAVVAGAVASALALFLALSATFGRDAADTDEGRPARRRAVAARRTRPQRAAAPSVAAAPERRARLDRADLWIVVAVAVAALSLRGWRLGEPARFHFDEVYHVRTATEFLQDWNYGDPHAIYEYTHPHLAKYAIAEGLRLFGAPRLEAVTQYGTAITALAARPAGAVGGGRIYVATGEAVDVIDAATRTRIGRIDARGIVALASDPSGGLWGATATGEIFRADAAAAEGTDASGLERHLIDLAGVRAIAPAADGTAFLVAQDEVLHVDSGEIVERATVPGARDLVLVPSSDGERVLVAGTGGVTALSSSLASPVVTPLEGGAVDLVAIDWFDQPRVYAATPARVYVLESRGSGSLIEIARVGIPGATSILPNDATRMVHVLAPDRFGGALALWSVEPNGNARFDDTAIGGAAPGAGSGGAAIDASADLPGGGNGAVIVAHADGSVAQVAVGDLPAAWRWPGVIAGALAAALLVLLARLLTDRRDVAALVALLVLFDGAGFVQSRIGMNDVYLLAGVLGAACSFVALLQGRLRTPLAASAALAATGLLLGLALASKWVALYAIGGLGLIWLARSPIGRLAALVGLILLFALLLPAALATGPDAARLPNLPALAVALLAIVGTAAATWRAGGLSLRELAPRRIGALLYLPGVGATMFAALVVLPLGVYLLSYLPWVALGNRLVDGWPAGNSGQTLAELTASMYRYHDTLRVAHAASSPWWAWPLDLKPVWFYQDSFPALGGQWTGAIYDGGNALSRWIGVAGTIWLAREAWRRRSWGLASALVLYLALWLPWARIDRAAFQYHYYPSSQLGLIGLALLLADVRRGSDAAARLLRRALAAIIVAVPALWMLAGAACAVAGVGSVYAESQVCRSFGFATPGPIVGAIALVPATIGAWSILGVTDARRLLRWSVAAIAVVAVAWYPNWSALPLPTGLHNWYQGLLPTWTWPFQFGVTLEKPIDTPLFGGATLLVGGLLVGVAFATVGLLELRRRREFGEQGTKRNAVGRE